jgi:NADH:ubiquinone oxidoreductase subunit F (NADH-binding)
VGRDQARRRQPHYLCANADEGEPGTFKDRWILEHAPHLLIEGMLISAFALQVRHAFVYIRGEFDLPYRRLAAAVEEAYAAGLLGANIMGTGFSLRSRGVPRAGSYVCGEASALITSLEGKKGYPRNRPPRLTVRGLYQRPTVVNNVETLSNVPFITLNGGGRFQEDRHAQEPGTQLISISGHVAQTRRVRGRIRLRPGASSSTRTAAAIPGGGTPQVRRAGRHLDQGAYRRRDRDAHLDNTESLEEAGSGLARAA